MFMKFLWLVAPTKFSHHAIPSSTQNEQKNANVHGGSKKPLASTSPHLKNPEQSFLSVVNSITAPATLQDKH